MSQTIRSGNEAGTGTESPTKSEYDWLFAEDRCRMALDALEESTMPVELDVLAAAIAVEESDADDVDEATRTRVASALHHHHLPQMERLGVIDYDWDDNRITAYY